MTSANVSAVTMAQQAAALSARITAASDALRNLDSAGDPVSTANEFAQIFASLNGQGGLPSASTGSAGADTADTTGLETNLSSADFNPSDIASFVPGYTALGATGLAALSGVSGTTASTIASAFGYTSGTTSTGLAVTGSDVVANALQYLGQPYVWGGESLAEGGFDCSGLVQQVYANLGYSLPRTADVQQDVGTPVADITQAQPGDLLFFHDPATHVGIYIGNGKMIEAPKPGENVRIADVGTWGIPVSSISRIVGDSSLLTPANATGTSQTTNWLADYLSSTQAGTP